MTRPHLLTKPNVKGVPLVSVRDMARRHVTIIPPAYFHHSQSVLGNSGFTMDGTHLSIGGSSSVYKALNAEETGAWIEWKLGYLDCTRAWSVAIYARPGPNRGIVMPSINGVNLSGGAMDMYSTGYTATYKIWSWNPTVNDMWKSHVLRFTVTGKNASSSNYGLAIHSIFVDRSAGADSIAPAQPT